MAGARSPRSAGRRVLTRSGADTGKLRARRATIGIAASSLVEREIELGGEGSDPGNDVTEFVELFGAGALTHRLSEFPHLFGEPGDRLGQPAFGVSGSIGRSDGVLERGDIHAPHRSGSGPYRSGPVDSPPMTVRTRMAPSPTGEIHVGTARTALFNFLFARHHGGEFLFRIEDTDTERSREEHVTSFLETLHWLGIDWDGEPMRQSSRAETYLDAAEQLLKSGDAYPCYCTEDEIRARNDAALAAGKTPGYDGRCRNLTEVEIAAFEAEGRARSLRFRTPDEGVSSFDDLIRGTVTVAWEHIPDFVIVRSSGAPVFFLANAVDDAAQGITHAIRGADILDTTHRVLAIRRALGITDELHYAHVPLILAPEGGKLSKRHGAVAVEEFRRAGYLPEAIVNYIALLGWSPSGEEEVLDLDTMVADFSLERVTQSSAVFDPQKLLWLNGEHLRRLSTDELRARLAPLARERFGDRFDADTFSVAVALGQERATTLQALLDQMTFLFVADADFVIADASWEKLTATERVAEILDATATHLETCDWTAEAIDLRPVLDGLGIKARKGMPAIYAAVEGSHTGLPLFDSICLLGRDRAIERVRAARKRLG